MIEQPEPLPPRARYSGIALLGLVVTLLVANVVWIARNCDSLRSVGPGTRAPEFDLPTLGGDRVRLKDLRGRVVLIDFWSVICSPCWEGLKHLKTVQRRFAGKPVTVLAIHVHVNRRAQQRARATAAQLGLRFPVLLDTANIRDRYTVRVLPTIVLINRQGTVHKVWRGVTPTATLSGEIEALLTLT
jgi:peroxiredoxin